MNCRDCEDNENGLCDRYGRLVDDDDTCCPIYHVRCSWCGKRSVLKKLIRVDLPNKTWQEYQFYCQTCRQTRYFRWRDIERERED